MAGLLETLRSETVYLERRVPSFLGGGTAYPSHVRPVEVHVMQKGFVSSHLTRRVLKLVVRTRKQCRLGETNLQIEHPVRTFNLERILSVARRITL